MPLSFNWSYILTHIFISFNPILNVLNCVGKTLIDGHPCLNYSPLHTEITLTGVCEIKKKRRYYPSAKLSRCTTVRKLKRALSAELVHMLVIPIA